MTAESTKKSGSANPAVLAMDHPITTLMLVVGLISLGFLAFEEMQVNIFPDMHIPKIYVFFDFIGMSPDQIEGFIVNELELYFQYVDGIKDIKSRNVQQVGLLELGFFPKTDMGQAMAQVVAMSDRAMSWMPPGALPPMIMRMDAGSVPIGYLVFKSEAIKPHSERWEIWRTTSSGPWCRRTFPAPLPSRRSARICARSSSTSIRRNSSPTT